MAGVTTNTTMNMEHFHDLYFLLALEAAVTTEIGSKPELEFSKPVEKFADDLDRTMEKIFPNMALRVFMYLYAACLGEARHARDTVARERYLKAKNNMTSRSSWFRDVVNFPPTEQNLGTLRQVFAQDWRAGYGGDAWGNIAQALCEYQTTPPGAWLDHVVDLEHNNGTAFSKPDGEHTIFFDVNYPSRFSNFLDYKFSQNILTDEPNFRDTLSVSPRVFALLTRYSTIFNKPAVTHAVSELDNLSDYVVEWGDDVLEIEDKWGNWISVGYANKPSLEGILEAAGLNSFYPSYYTKDKFQAKIKRIKTRAIGLLSEKYKTPYMKAKISKKLKEYYTNHLGECKMDKPPKTFSMMPCTVHTVVTDKPMNVLTFDLPYQEGYGTAVDGKFQVNIYTGAQVVTDEAYVEKHYGDLVLYTNRQHYWLSSGVLEALLD